MPQNKEKGTLQAEALVVKNINVRSDRGFLALNDLSLSVHSGEIVGLAGVSGNGQRELAEAINGLRHDFPLTSVMGGGIFMS